MIFIKIIQILFQVYTLMLFARILGSWLPQLQEYKIFQFICYYTDPYLNFFRKFIPPLGMIDFSPIVAFLLLNVLQNIFVNIIIWLIV